MYVHLAILPIDAITAPQAFNLSKSQVNISVVGEKYTIIAVAYTL